MFVVFIAWILVLQQFDGNILGPLILGDATGLSGVWVLLAILIGGDLFGVAGMVLGVPIFACIYAFFAVQLRDKLRAKKLSSNTGDYIRLRKFDDETGEPVYREKHERRRSLREKRTKGVFRKLKHKIRGDKDVDKDVDIDTDDAMETGDNKEDEE